MKTKRWVLKLILDEQPPEGAEDVGLITQLELTRAIGRAASSLEAQFDGLKVVDYRIHCNGREQPEVESLEAVKRFLAH